MLVKPCPDGSVVGADDCYHETAVDYVMEQLGFCACGNPDGMVGYVRGAMELLEAGHGSDSTAFHYFDSVLAADFMWYWLDSKGYTTHGGAIPGWLTDSGVELLKYIQTYCPEVV